jgi:hypothetical protein
MKTTLALLAATTALGAMMSIPAIGATRTTDADSPKGAFSTSTGTAQEGVVLLASGEDEDDDEGDDCDDDDEVGCAAGSNPAPAGTVAPPANGLFSTGAAPLVQVN